LYKSINAGRPSINGGHLNGRIFTLRQVPVWDEIPSMINVGEAATTELATAAAAPASGWLSRALGLAAVALALLSALLTFVVLIEWQTRLS
jgi:hypothetical protein